VLADPAGSPPDLVTMYSPVLSGDLPQVEPMFRAASKFVAARGNRSWSVTFVVNRQHASIAAAFSFPQSHAASIPNGVDLKFEESGNTLYLANAVLTGFDPGEPGGVSTTIKYTFVGQSYQSTAP